MKPGSPAGKAAANKPKRGGENAFVRWKFEDGRTGDLALADVWLQLLNQFAAAAASDDPHLRIWGRQKLREVAATLAHADVQPLVASDRARKSAKSPRGRALDPHELARELKSLKANGHGRKEARRALRERYAGDLRKSALQQALDDACRLVPGWETGSRRKVSTG